MVTAVPGTPAVPVVLVANEPRAYREVLVAVLAELRPGLAVEAVAPGKLDGELTSRRAVVVCSQLTAAVRARACAWIVLYPGAEPVAVAGGPWGERAIPSPDLYDVLGAVEEAVGRCRSRPPRILSTAYPAPNRTS